MASNEAHAGTPPGGVDAVGGGVVSLPTPGLNELGQATLASGLEAPSAARAAVSGWLAQYVVPAVLEDARLLVTELVANSVRHAAVSADSPISVMAAQNDGTVRVEVADLGRDARVVPASPDPRMAGGLGLHLLEAIATRWGVTHQSGTHVWFELPSRSST